MLIRRFNYARLAELRDAKGFSPTMLAGLVGVTEPTYRRWEAGRKAPQFVTGVKLADVLEVHPRELVKVDATEDPRP
jgi:transcriptional regulator with XRE-family HTH domain